MARIQARNDISMMKIRSFLGLNENPDGDTTLKTGEMAEMRNFRITQDGHMQIRPGSRTVADLAEARRAIGGDKAGKTALRGLWHGVVGSAGHTLCAWGGYIWDVNVETGKCRSLGAAVTYDDNDEQEYYIVCGDKALVHNYGCDAWYYYTDVPMRCMVKLEGVLYFGTPDGRIMEFSRRYRNDDKRDIDAYWESGSMAFDREWMRKYSSLVWVGIKPETQAVLTMTAQSNRKSDYPEKIIASGLANFTHASFAHWSFGTNRKPQVIRAKLKVKKATFYKLILYSKSASATATIVSVDIQVRYTGNVK